MLTFLSLASLAMTGLMVAAVVMVAVVVLKALFFLVTLPFRIVFAVAFFPIWLAKTVAKLAIASVVVPLVALGGVILAALAAIAAIAAIIAPLLPIIILALLVWAVVRSFRPAAV